MSISPDIHGVGLFEGELVPARYDGHNDDPNEVAGIIRRMMPSNAKVLDVGCGTASVTAIANRAKNNTVICIEPDKIRAEIARQRGFNVTCGYLDKAFIASNGPFDALVMSDVLEHTADPESLLALAKSALKPNGLLIISVPNIAHWSTRLMLFCGNFNYTEVGIMDSTHLRWFTARTIRRLVEGSSFKIGELTYTAGVTLPIYRKGMFRILPGEMIRLSIRNLKKVFPKLFGCQFVIKATL